MVLLMTSSKIASFRTSLAMRSSMMETVRGTGSRYTARSRSTIGGDIAKEHGGRIARS